MLIRRIVVVLTLLAVCACKKESITYNEFIILNNSGVTVEVLPTSVMFDTLSLKNNELKKFEFSFNRGIGTGINYATFADGNPVIVVFNKKDTVIHYNDVLQHDKMYYSQTSTRSFYNTSSYQKQIVDDTKYQRTVTLIYTFTPKDYLDAKK